MKNLLTLVSIFFFNSVLFAAVPDWSLDENAFENSMSITGVLEFPVELSRDSKDVIAAFVNGECRGITQPIYNADLDQYYVFLLVLSNASQADEITFKMYDDSEDSVYDCINSLSFNIDQSIGEISSPFRFTTNRTDAEIISFDLSNANVWVTIDSTNRTIELAAVEAIEVDSLIANFELSDGAIAKVSTVLQVSATTSNDFSSALIYTITSADGTIVSNWTIELTQDKIGVEENQTQLIAAYPNPVSTTLWVKIDELSTCSQLNLIDLTGKKMNSRTVCSNQFIEFSTAHLSKGIYFLELKNGEKMHQFKLVKQ